MLKCLIGKNYDYFLKLIIAFILLLIFSQFTMADCLFASSPSFSDDFNSLNSTDWSFANWSFDVGDTYFLPQNGSFSDGKLFLTLKKEQYAGKKYTGAELRTNTVFSYGKYEIDMQAALGGGLVSSFFLYSDFDRANGAWSEIDIEFIHNPQNNDKPTIQFNHWNKVETGATGNELRIEELLINSFGLRQNIHSYTIEYTPTYIKWYINGVLYHTATENIPQSNTLKVMMNIWQALPSDSQNWAGIPSDDYLPSTAIYDRFAYYPLVNCSFAPVANFSVDKRQGKAPLLVQFNDLSLNNPSSWFWDFGDGNTSTLANPTNQYSQTGNYTVKLTVSNDSGSDIKEFINYISVSDIDFANSKKFISYPNPFSPYSGEIAKLIFSLENDSEYKIYIINASGAVLRKMNGIGFAGINDTLTWDGKDYKGDIVPNGVYLISIIAKDKVLYNGKIAVLD